jgi:hypothetical protein
MNPVRAGALRTLPTGAIGQRPHGCEPRSLKPPTSVLTDPCFREPCYQRKVGNQVDYVWFFFPYRV